MPTLEAVIAEAFSSAQSVLEIGSSAGGHTHGFDGEVTVIDLDEAKLAASVASAKRVQALKHDLSVLPLPVTRKYDCVICFEVVEHLERPQALALIDELERVTSKGGTLIISTPNVNNITQLLRWLVTRDLTYYGSFTTSEKFIYFLRHGRFPDMDALSQEFKNSYDGERKDITRHRCSFSSDFFQRKGFHVQGFVGDYIRDILGCPRISSVIERLFTRFPAISGSILAKKKI